MARKFLIHAEMRGLGVFEKRLSPCCVCQTVCGTQGVLDIKDLGSQWVVAGVCAVVGGAGGGTSKSGGDTGKAIIMLFCPSVSQKCSNFPKCHHALAAHTTRFYIAANSGFTIFGKIFIVLGLFLHWEKKGDRKIGNREIDVK
jgi:hypothetical protein